MKKYILLALLFTLNIDAQFFKKTYDNIFKYATIYVAGDMREAYETKYPDYFIRTNPDDLYAIPDVIDETIYHPFDYRVGIGIRKLARYDQITSRDPFKTDNYDFDS